MPVSSFRARRNIFFIEPWPKQENSCHLEAATKVLSHSERRNAVSLHSLETLTSEHRLTRSAGTPPKLQHCLVPRNPSQPKENGQRESSSTRYRSPAGAENGSAQACSALTSTVWAWAGPPTPQFPHLQNGDTRGVSLTGLLCRSIIPVQVKYLVLGLQLYYSSVFS